MKHALLRKSAAAIAASLFSAGLAQAHPGHSAFDWFTAPPHSGHEHEIFAALLTLAIIGAIWGGCHVLRQKP
jgi:hypothetical protein